MRFHGRFNTIIVFLLILNLFSVFVTANPALAQDRPALTYFALGDSYASGHGLAGEEGSCRRSPLAYPYGVRTVLSEAYSVELEHLGCSGATAGPHPETSRERPMSISTQFEIVNEILNERRSDGITDPVLVTITIGANDVGISDMETLQQIVRPAQMWQPRIFFTGLIPHVTLFGPQQSIDQFNSWLDGKIAPIVPSLTSGINQLLTYENVRIVITDYPNPFRRGGFGICNTLSATLTCDEAMRSLLLRLNSVVLDQVVRIDDSNRLQIANLGSRFASHYSDCAPFAPSENASETWFQQDIQATGDLWADLVANMDQCFHPNKEGAQAIADAVVERALTMLPAPVTAQPTQAPSQPVPPPSSQGFHLPWEAGSIWQITGDNTSAHHADQWNRYAFDAVPDPGRSTPHVTAIADGTVVGFQADVPNSALFSQGHAGNCMMIRHADGTVSLYAHLAENSIPGELRQEGAAVRSGMVIGTVGNTGFASGVHLHWSLVSDGRMLDSEGYRTCYGPSIPSQYADNDAELIEDGGVPRTGRYYASTNDVSGSTQQPPAAPNPPSCNDTGLPHLSEGLSISPANPDTATEVTFSFTITNTGCGTFLPEVLAIGGRDPSGAVSDPLQVRDFSLAPGESRSITHSVVLSAPGTHEFFMAFLRQGGGWNRIADPSGSTASIYITVTEASTTQPDDPGTTQAETAPMDIGASGPNGHEIGARFTVTTTDGAHLGECTLEGDPADPLVVSCRVDVPRYTAVVVTLDESTITPGYAPVENPVTFDTSGDPGAASHWGVFFQIEQTGGDREPGQTSDIAIETFLDGSPYYDACYVLVDFSLEGCDRNSDGHVTFQDVPLGAYTVRQTANLPNAHVVQDFPIDVKGNPDGGYETFPAYVEAGGDTSIVTESITQQSESAGPSDLMSLLPSVADVPGGMEEDGRRTRRLPDVADNYTNPDETTQLFTQWGWQGNAVTSFALPSGQEAQSGQVNGVYVSIHQFSSPDGARAALDFSLAEQAAGTSLQEVSAGLLGEYTRALYGPMDYGNEVTLLTQQGGLFIRVSVAMLDGDPTADAERIVAAIVAKSTTQAPPAGGSVTESGDGQVIEPDNGGSGGSGAIVPAGSGSSNSGGTGQAPLLMIFRACPEGFDPNTGDFFNECTIPLDAPDASFLYHGGDGQGGVNITWLDRQYNGEYVFNAGPYTMTIELSGLAPVVRNAYQVVGADWGDGSTFTVNLVDGETRKVYIFYYYT